MLHEQQHIQHATHTTIHLLHPIALDLLLNRTTNTNTNTGSSMFPPLNVKGANLHLIEPRKPSELALADVQKVGVILYLGRAVVWCVCCMW